MRTRGNKAQNDKDSILADTKNLLVILHPAIQKMPKIERMEGAPHEMKMACYSIIKHFTMAKECPEVRADNIREMFGDYGELLAAFDLCIHFGLLTDGERLNVKYNLHLKRHGKPRNSRPNQCTGVPAA